MKKNGFLEGAMIATIGIVLCKIIGLVYVIPFYAIIGNQGGALYSYAYSIYAIFLSLSSSGIPIAVSKIVSEYHSLGFNKTKEKAYKIGKLLIVAIGFISFLVLFIFAKDVANLIIGNIEGGNTIEGVTMVIRVVSTALLIVPLLSVSRGYLQGHKYMTASSISNVIEQIARVLVIIVGSFLALKVFNLSLETSVGIAVFGATIGAICAYFYIFNKVKKSKKLNNNTEITQEESKITTKDIVKKIVFYALPFIIIDLIKSAYSMVDTFTVVKTMDSLGYTAIESETAIGVMATWASKLNTVVISIAIGLTISLIPNIASSYVKKDFKDVSKKINQSLKALLFMILPMTIGIFLLAKPVWIIFYGYDLLSIDIFKLYVFQAITFSFFSVLIDAAQTMNNTKLTFGVLLVSLILKALLNVPSMNICDSLGIGAYYGPIIVTLLIQILSTFFILFVFNRKYKVTYKDTLKTMIKVIISLAIMIMSILIVRLFYNNTSLSRGSALLEIIVYTIIGSIFYFFSAYKSGLVTDVFGKNLVNAVLKKLRLKR